MRVPKETERRCVTHKGKSNKANAKLLSVNIWELLVAIPKTSKALCVDCYNAGQGGHVCNHQELFS
jgi:hypothetical protein